MKHVLQFQNTGVFRYKLLGGPEYLVNIVMLFLELKILFYLVTIST